MFSNLTDEDFVYEEGQKEFMLKKLGDKLGKSEAELEVIFAQIQQSWTVCLAVTYWAIVHGDLEFI